MLFALCALALAQDDVDAPPDVGLFEQVNVTGGFDVEGRYYTSDRVLADHPNEEGIFNYGEVVSRSNVLVDSSNWQLGAQFDHVSMFNAWYFLDDEKVYEFDLLANGVRSPWEMSSVNLEKTWLTVNAGPVEIGLGDQYMSVGRGLALNLVKNTDIDVDTTVLGARLNSTVGMWDLAFISGLTNQQQIQQDNPNRQLRPSVHNLVNAVRVDRYGVGPFNLGAHAVSYNMADSAEPLLPSFSRYGDISELDALVGGGSIEGFLGPADVFVEGDYFHYRSERLFTDGEIEPGYALYGSTAFYPGRFTVLVEGKSYKNTERLNSLTTLEGYEIAVGPSLEYERVITEDSSAGVNSNDIYGGRARVDFMAKPGEFIPYFSLGVFRDRELGGLHFNRSMETIIHPVVGMDLQGALVTAIVNGGVRTDLRDDHGRDNLVHLDASVSFPLPGSLHGDVTWDIYSFWWGDNENQQHDFYTSTMALAAHHPSGFSFLVYNDFTDDPLAQAQAKGNVADNIYMAGELQYKPNDRTAVRAFYGAYKAGIRCAGGQCRQLPGFDGARLAVTTTF